MASANQIRLKEAMSTGSGVGSKVPCEPDGELTNDTSTGAERNGSDDCASDDQPSSSYTEHTEGEDPSSRYGKYTWRVPSYSAISKRELRSKSFSVGDYAFYILVYPTGCGEGTNHLSLFLCVVDYDKLLPGWSHLAQFTVALVHKDPKSSKYSDTLHRFCKKEHDWGWKRFMEVGKVLEEYTVDGTLTIKVQVQIIRDNSCAPFRCLDSGYKRELLRVYSSHVDSLCMRFLDERRTQLQVLLNQLPVFRSFWAGLTEEKRQSLVTERSEVVLKGLVRRFFNEKEVTSTLLMDAVFSGCHQIQSATAAGPSTLMAGAVEPVVYDTDKSIVFLQGDVFALLRGSAAHKPLAPASDQGPPVARTDANLGGSSASLGASRDEKRLSALGRHTVEVFVVSHLFLDHLATAFWDAECTRRQDALIQAEEASEAELDARTQAKAAADRERKLRKKAKRKAKQMVDAVERQATHAEAAAFQEAERAEVAATRLARAQAAAAAAVAAATAATSATISANEAEGTKKSGIRTGSATDATSANKTESENALSQSESHQVRQLRRQVAQMTARITEQNNELILLRAEVAAHRTSSISLPDGQCSSEQPSAVTDDGGSAANRPAELRRNGGVQVIPVVTGKQQTSSRPGGASSHHRSAASSQDSGSSAALRPSTPAAALDGGSRLSGLDSRDSSALGSPVRCPDSCFGGSRTASDSSRPTSPTHTITHVGSSAVRTSKVAVRSEHSNNGSANCSGGIRSSCQHGQRAQDGSSKAGAALRGSTNDAAHTLPVSARGNGHARNSRAGPLDAAASGVGVHLAGKQLRPAQRDPQATKIISGLNKNASLFVPAATKQYAVTGALRSATSRSAALHPRASTVQNQSAALPSSHSAAPSPRGSTARGNSKRASSAEQRLPATLSPQPLPSFPRPPPSSSHTERTPFLQPARSALLPLSADTSLSGTSNVTSAAVTRSSSLGAICQPVDQSQGLGSFGNENPVLDGFAHMGLITDLFD